MAISLLMLTNAGRAPAHVLVKPLPATGYVPGGGHRAASAALSVAIAGVIGVGLATALVAPQMLSPVDPPLTTTNVPMPPAPPPADPDARPREAEGALSRMTTVATALTDSPVTVAVSPESFASIPQPRVESVDLRPVEPLPLPPIMRAPRRDMRFAGQFQPPYPAARQREQVEGSCRVAVSIAASGRVTAVRPLSCPDDAFFRATERQALSRWRFHPATRDGEPVAGDIEQNVIFRLTRE